MLGEMTATVEGAPAPAQAGSRVRAHNTVQTQITDTIFVISHQKTAVS